MLIPAEAPGTPMPQLVGGSQRALIESHRGIQDTLGIRRVNLQGGVMGGDNAQAARPSEEVRNRNREGRALFGIGRRAQLVQQYQRFGVA